MAKYRKRPVVVEAEQFHQLQEPYPKGVVVKLDQQKNTFRAAIKTLEGTLWVNDKDWIITGIKGEKYPCKPDIFEQTYEKVE